MADVTMPQLGETVTEGTITKWFKQVGDQVAEDEVLFEVSTDKVDSEVPSPAGGYLAEIRVPEGAAAPDAQPAAEPAPEAASEPAPEPEPERAPPPAPPAAAPTASPPPAPAPAAAPAPAPAAGGPVLSPVVRRLLNEHGLDPSQVQGTGAGGRITRNDVLAVVEGKTAPAAPAPAPAPAT